MEDDFPMLSEDDRIEMWNLSFFVELEFSGEQCADLLSWKIDPHVAKDLLYRDGVRTRCTHKQAMRILTPDLVPA